MEDDVIGGLSQIFMAFAGILVAVVSLCASTEIMTNIHSGWQIVGVVALLIGGLMSGAAGMWFLNRFLDAPFRR